ncbi:MAG: hypothetical protein CO096_05855 [Armatimonadetes bacterium CG_4_9_14_3_um_filter_66_14]|nr:MAG: hypothetical protein CO096_05855 [Armatimonadetes bacterium CG_4_9_14_3_um_filter_66_14]
MRIAHYAPFDFAAIGGAQAAVVFLSRALLRLGHQVEIVCHRGAPDLEVPSVPLRTFEPERYDVVHSHAHLCLWSPWFRRRVRCHLHSLQGTTLGLRLACGRPKAIVNPGNWRGVIAEAYAAHLADHVIAVSRRARQDAIRLYGVPGGKVSVIPNGHGATGRSLPAAVRARWRQRLGLSDETVAFLFVGREEDYVKNVRCLLWAYRLVRQTTDHIRLVMAPGGRAAPAGVVCTGTLASKELAELYGSVEALVLTSFYEGGSLAVMEALGAGLPVLATPVGNVPEVIDHLVNGIRLAPTGRDLPSWMRRVAADAGLRARLGSAARAAARAYTWDRLAEQTVQAYEQALGRCRT